jgi:electron transport complex protein RnfB
MLSILVISAIALVLGALLGAAAAHFKEDTNALADKVNTLLPHTQCAQCGYPGCRPYADAVARGEAAITLCPPGGGELIKNLSDLIGVPPPPTTASAPLPAHVAFIDESRCVGCALCLPACPVDAIVGAPRHMHSVIAAQCTGCELCLAPCPVDCIAMRAATEPRPRWRLASVCAQAAARSAGFELPQAA